MISTKKFSMRVIAGAAIVSALVGLGQANAATDKQPEFSRAGAIGAITGQPRAATTLADLVINAAGVASFDAEGAAGNTLLTLNVLPNSTVDAIAYNLSLTTVGASWLSEAVIGFTNSEGLGVFLTPGNGVSTTGSGTYTGSASLVALGLSFNVGADGLLFVEFFESYDDVAGAADAFYTAGNITFGNIGAVPEPSTYGLMALGLLGVAGVARRKAAKAA